MENIQFASRFDGISGSAIREIFKVLAVPGMISFAGGNPSRAALPDAQARLFAEQALAEDGKTILQYGATEGYRPFLESLRPWAEQRVGAELPAILPVTGSTQAMDLLCKALINPGDAILVEDPSFLGNMQCMKLYQARLIPMPSDEQGVLPEAVEALMAAHHPKLMYIIPNFQNPTGKTLPVDRRQALAELAARYRVVIAEDDPYRDLRYEGQPLPTIKSFDQEGWVMYLGSFSKIISPGLRVGYLAGDADIVRKCTMGKQSTDLHTDNLSQAIVDRFLRSSQLDSHIQTICASYRQQRDAMLAELSGLPEGTSFVRPEGGLFIWCVLPEGANALRMLSRALERKVAYVPGTHFYVNGAHENTFRLNFSGSTLEQIHTGMSVLRELIAGEAKA